VFAPVNEVTMGSGQSTTVVVETIHYFITTPEEFPPPPLISSNPAVFTLMQSPDSTNVILQAHRAGTAYLTPADRPDIVLVTVQVFECAPVSIQPLATDMAALVGAPVLLQVVTAGIEPLGTDWYQETVSGWSPSALGHGPYFGFTPHVSGTFRFQAHYRDLCGDASTIITVVASTRTHAVRR
jgi:hypothetical protein